MFTGIIKELGIVRNITKAGTVYRLNVESKDIAGGLKTGDSVSVNGVCLTLVGNKGGILSFDVMKETVRRTNLAGLKNGRLLEAAEAAGFDVLITADQSIPEQPVTSSSCVT